MTGKRLLLGALLTGCASGHVLAIGGSGCWSCDPSGRMAMGGTQSLFLGENGAGQFNRSVESSSGERLRAGLTRNDPLATDFLEREAVELSNLHGASPPQRLAAEAAAYRGARGEFLQAGVRRYAYVLAEAKAHPVADPCSYTGPLIPAGAENYDPRELCWWQGTFALLHGE
ncbi:MAG: hypothetical protein KGR26_07875 [Cyanobacteria bacterium REEB65]|nr:hypothetical protein [Cyanobacteria bacterium REEB65]